MIFTRLSRLNLLFTAFIALVSGGAAYALEDGCIVNLQSDLKRQDLADAIGLTYFKERPKGITREVIELPRSEAEIAAKKKIQYEIKYFTSKGKLITDAEKIKEFDSLGIPPVYTDVWISPDAESHILAIGYDKLGRPQYAYHPEWTQATSVTKFIRMAQFGKNLVNVRQAVMNDLRKPGITREKLLAAASVILETGSIRVGSVEYAEKYKTYGLTTLLKSHVKVSGDEVFFDFIGKEAVPHKFSLKLPEVAPILAELLSQPGKRLFKYVDENGAFRSIDGPELTEYLQGHSQGQIFTNKDYRTWQGTATAAKKLIEVGPASDPVEVQKNISSAVLAASQVLRNRPATARENYIHPQVLEAYATGSRFAEVLKKVKSKKADSGLSLEERFVLELVKD